MTIKAYRTPSGAQRYADALAAKWPNRAFKVVPHPHAFAYAVGVFSPATCYDAARFVAYSA